MRLVVDTCVLKRASEASGETVNNAVVLLDKIYRKCDTVVVDKIQSGSRILKEYRSQAQGYASQWLSLMATRRRKLLKTPIRSPAPSTKLDKYDKKFVAACTNSGSTIIITEDSGFFRSSSHLMKVGIKVLSIEEALSTLYSSH